MTAEGPGLWLALERGDSCVEEGESDQKPPQPGFVAPFPTLREGETRHFPKEEAMRERTELTAPEPSDFTRSG